MAGDKTAQVRLGRFVPRELKGDLVRFTRHPQGSGQSVEPADVVVGHLPPLLGGTPVPEDVHVVVGIEEDHGPEGISHS